MHFSSASYTCLELLPTVQTVGAEAILSCANGTEKKSAFCWCLRFTITPNTDYTLSLTGAEPGFCYLSHGDNLCEDGITVLSPSTNTITPCREQFHFTPPCGWLNDPNGLCWHNGWYHLYYQFYPHTQAWGNMHWGHAISLDLINWKHQPIFLTPQQALLEDSSLVGGAFSGSAIADDKGILFALTRHISPRDDESKMIETQITVHSENGISCGVEKTIIERENSCFSYHFRDPKLYKEANRMSLVLGSCVDKFPAILHYTQQANDEWKYDGVVLSIDEPDCESIECPDLFHLGEGSVAIAAQMNRTEPCGRKNPLYWYYGTMENHTLAVDHKGLFDFGGNLYALQTFAHDGRQIAVGWIADFYNEHQIYEGGVYGSMSLPRELRWKNNRLYQKPVKEAYQLLGNVVADKLAENLYINAIPRNCYYAHIIMRGDTDFTAVLASDGDDSLQFCRKDDRIFFSSDRVHDVVFDTVCKSVKNIEIFFDRRVAEVFVNDGEYAGTKTFYCGNMTGSFSFTSLSPELIESIIVHGIIQY